MLQGIMSEREYCLYLRDSVSERIYNFYMFPYKLLSLVPNPKKLYSVHAIKPIDICYTCYK